MSDLETLPQPIAPGIDPERLQRLRDCWRPEVQQNSALNKSDWEGIDFRIAEREAIDRAYAADLSLYSRFSTYIIPPAVSRRVEAALQEADPEVAFYRSFDTTRKGVAHAAKSFANYFVFDENACYNAYYRACFHKIQTNVRKVRNYDRPGWSYEMVGSKGTFAVDTKHVELNISQANSRYSDEDRGQSERHRTLEVGLFGWVLPISEKNSPEDESAVSLLKAGRFLVAVSWDKNVPDKLNFEVAMPELSHAGHLLVEAAIAENEHLLPNGATYEDTLTYHQRLENPTHNQDWRFSRGDNAQGLADHQARMDEWLMKKPLPYRWR